MSTIPTNELITNPAVEADLPKQLGSNIIQNCIMIGEHFTRLVVTLE